MPKICDAKVESKPCEKSSFATCDGCRQSFCLPHLTMHHQQLLTKMEELVNIHDLLREELDKPRTHTLHDLPDFARELNLIDAWQTRAVAQVTKQITQEADRARKIVRQVIEENRRRVDTNEIGSSEDLDRLKKRLVMLSEQLQARMKLSDYIESDLRRWNTELDDIKKISLAPPAVKRMIVDELVMGEMRQVQIDVSNILSIEPEDPKYMNMSRYKNDGTDLMKTVKEKATGAYTYVAEKVDEATAAVENSGNREHRSPKT